MRRRSSRVTIAISLIPTLVRAFLFAVLASPSLALASTTIFLTSGTSWTVPNDWNNSANTIECIGGGGGGRGGTGTGNGGGGGGGGAYSSVSNQTYTPGQSKTIAIGALGGGATADATAGGTGGDTSIKQDDNSTTACLAKGGTGGGATGGSGGGGASGSGTGSTKNSGGAGGTGTFATLGRYGGGGGGGAAGPSGVGKAGGNVTNASANFNYGAGGGGGANGGSSTVGANANSNVGTNGGDGNDGTGHGTAGGNATAGKGAGGGGGGGGFPTGTGGGAGSQQDIWTQTSDSATAGPAGGGGGGGASNSGTGGVGGSPNAGYGGGGGGGGNNGAGASANGGGGTQGIIIITYTPVSWTQHSVIALTVDTIATGNVTVVGSLSKGSGTFMIDDPLDPKNELLYHSFVESPDVTNVYDGTATLDRNGEAVIPLPDYFLALNKDYRYLAQGVDAAMPNLHLRHGVYRQWFFGRPIFSIAGGTPGGTISWQVTGTRKDPLILKNPIVPEVMKSANTIVPRGVCLFPPLCK